MVRLAWEHLGFVVYLAWGHLCRTLGMWGPVDFSVLGRHLFDSFGRGAWISLFIWSGDVVSGGIAGLDSAVVGIDNGKIQWE